MTRQTLIYLALLLSFICLQTAAQDIHIPMPVTAKRLSEMTKPNWLDCAVTYLFVAQQIQASDKATADALVEFSTAARIKASSGLDLAVPIGRVEQILAAHKLLAQDDPELYSSGYVDPCMNIAKQLTE